ncbi:hypothetical protein [Nocardia sp. BMG51109]|uniref:hypothetical protein n=1 Tax=Nocardia sp. BMG51109 TaxID=1056816 RepID=UPI0004643E9F|nr:hypothetical protein [Nocardia sp. BMG51109]
MSEITAWWMLAGLLVIAGGVVWLLLRSGRDYERKAPTQPLWTIGWTHEAPPYEPGVAGAHKIMQQHRACDREDCPRKRVAWQVLVEAGHIRPDSTREY